MVRVVPRLSAQGPANRRILAALAAFAALPLTTVLAAAATARAHGDWGVAYAPRDPTSTRPAIVFLHGMWASPEDSCEPFEAAATPFGFLVCPRGNARLRVRASDNADAGASGAWVDDDGDAGLKMWSGSAGDAARSIDAALEAADALAPGKRSRLGGTLIGFSNGAYFAAEVASAEPGRWTGLVLLSMKLDLDAARLGRAGVARVVLAAGDRDESRPAMQALAARLASDTSGPNGSPALESRYMSLGDVGHEFPRDMGAKMCEAISWVRAAPKSACESACKTQ
jgi:pimeloyl-ACP methyl ester carboxylesterase